MMTLSDSTSAARALLELFLARERPREQVHVVAKVLNKKLFYAPLFYALLFKLN